MWSVFKHLTHRKVRLVKECKLTKDGWDTQFFVEINGSYVSHSYTTNESTAEKFFERVISMGGKVKSKEIIKTQFIKR